MGGGAVKSNLEGIGLVAGLAGARGWWRWWREAAETAGEMACNEFVNF